MVCPERVVLAGVPLICWAFWASEVAGRPLPQALEVLNWGQRLVILQTRYWHLSGCACSVASGTAQTLGVRSVASEHLTLYGAVPAGWLGHAVLCMRATDRMETRRHPGRARMDQESEEFRTEVLVS